MSYTLLQGDCFERLREMPAESVDAVVTDPPYELGFMGKAWDGTGIAFNAEFWAEVMRVLKPGGHCLAFSGSRTYHRMACAIEDAGFEVRDQIMWIYGSGFPKSKNLDGDFSGWGTALKPAHEPICMARKPLAGTVAVNMAAYGVGALNIAECRVPLTSADDEREFESNHNGCNRSLKPAGDKLGLHGGGWKLRKGDVLVPDGRWPSNVLHDGSDEVVSSFPHSRSGAMRSGTQRAAQDGPGSVCYGTYGGNATSRDIEASSGSAARFFCCAKASRSDRNEGCESLAKRPLNWSSGSQNPGSFQAVGTDRASENHHPTVKPAELMGYLVRLVTPRNGVVLDPFMGSGSTGKACMQGGFAFVGIEREAEYFEIASARVKFAHECRVELEATPKTVDMFGDAA